METYKKNTLVRVVDKRDLTESTLAIIKPTMLYIGDYFESDTTFATLMNNVGETVRIFHDRLEKVNGNNVINPTDFLLLTETDNVNEFSFFVSVEVKTKKDYLDVVKAVERGIYRGLDGEPYHIAQPKDVKISMCR